MLLRQFSAFAGVGLIAAIVHYSLLIGLVEAFGIVPVPATLAGYLGGGLVSYVLSRRHVFASGRPHEEASWRFVLVAGAGFGLTFLFMHFFVDRLKAPYLPAQLVTTGIVACWSFAANKFWTFRFNREAGRSRGA
ncbi:MAG: GtrA family protein [Methylovirgula sp.]